MYYNSKSINRTTFDKIEDPNDIISHCYLSHMLQGLVTNI